MTREESMKFMEEKNKEFLQRVTENNKKPTFSGDATKKRLCDAYIIDSNALKQTCAAINDVATLDLLEIAKEVRSLGNDCNEKVLSIENQTFQDNFEELARQIEEYIRQIEEYTEAILNRLPIVLSKQEAYVDKLYEQKKKEQEQAVLYTPIQ